MIVLKRYCKEMISKNKKWDIVFWVMVCCISPIRAQQADSVMLPSFIGSFKGLYENRRIYNAYNDSIFLVKDKDAWVNFFRRRAQKNHDLFEDNKRIIQEIKDYFSQDKRMIPNDAYRIFERDLEEYVYSGKSDPFLTLEFCKILEEHYRTLPDSLNGSSLVNIWSAINWANVANLGNDTLALRRSYDYFKRNLSEKNKTFPSYMRGKIYSLWNLSKTNWITNHFLTVEESQNFFQQFKDLLQHERIDTLVTPDEYKNMIKWRREYDETMVRNVYMVDPSLMDKQHADSLMAVLVKRNLASKNLSNMNYGRTYLMQVKLGQITMDEALEKMLERYALYRKEMQGERISDWDLVSFLTPLFNLFYFNDMSSGSFAKKRKLVRTLCHDIEEAYQQRADQQVRTGYVKYLIQLTTYPRLLKYLTEDERIYFLNALNVATQVTTYAHSVHVSLLAGELMDGILTYQPSLLVGTLGCKNERQVRKQKEKFLQFIHDAAMYHDLGKNSIISVVHNDYRPLTDDEFAIIKRHPELGLKYLAIAPSLAKYRDTMLGHHKWYNGKGGYPTWFDNTKSPLRILIDVVTLSDCLQAATERVGRNYKGDKNFDTVMSEFRRDAGTRYNPDLVVLIDAHPDLAKKLVNLVNDGWEGIYYDIYQDFIQ